MPHSLRAKLSGLRYKGILEDKDYKRLCKALDNEKVLEQIRKEMNDLEKKTIEDVCLDECRPCVYTTFEYVRQVINRTWKG